MPFIIVIISYPFTLLAIVMSGNFSLEFQQTFQAIQIVGSNKSYEKTPRSVRPLEIKLGVNNSIYLSAALMQCFV